MSEFTSDLIVSPMPGGRKWKLRRHFEYYMGKKEGEYALITVPLHFETDFASIPGWRFFFFWLPYWAKYNKAPVLHDFMGRTGAFKQKYVDKVFYEAMLVAFREHKLGKVVAKLEYWAVSLYRILARKK